LTEFVILSQLLTT